MEDGAVISHREDRVRSIVSNHGNPEHQWGLGVRCPKNKFCMAVMELIESVDDDYVSASTTLFN